MYFGETNQRVVSTLLDTDEAIKQLFQQIAQDHDVVLQSEKAYPL